MHTLLIICSVAGAVFGLYFAFTCVAGLLRKQKDIPSVPPRRRIAAVIAARNEEAVIGDLVSSLMAQNYPRELFDIYVVPNNCTDRTEEIARVAGARILNCSGPIGSKGDALRCAFGQLTSMDLRYDAYCIFDADNLADPLFFRAVNDAREAGYRVAQGYRDSKNPYASWVSGSMSVFYWFMSRFYNGSRAALGMSAALNGTGFMVSDDLIREIGWETVTLTEDLEFSALCALNGVRIGFMPRARVYDEQPVGMKQSLIQRRRWSAGSLQCFRRYAARLYARRTVQSLDMALLFTGMLLNLLGLAGFISTVWQLASALASAPESAPALLAGTALSLILCYLLFCLMALFMFRLEKRISIRCLPAVLCFALFMLTWMPVNLLCFVTRAPKWKAITHAGTGTLAP